MFSTSECSAHLESKTGILNVAIFKHSSHMFREDVPHQKYQAIKPAHFLKVCSCVIMQKSDPYIKLFSILSGIRLVSCILSQLNILCTTLVKPYCTKMTIRQFFTVHTLRPMTDIGLIIQTRPTLYTTQLRGWSKTRKRPYLRNYRPTS